MKMCFRFPDVAGKGGFIIGGLFALLEEFVHVLSRTGKMLPAAKRVIEFGSRRRNMGGG